MKHCRRNMKQNTYSPFTITYYFPKIACGMLVKSE